MQCASIFNQRQQTNVSSQQAPEDIIYYSILLGGGGITVYGTASFSSILL